MTLTVTHTTPADGSFSATGAAAWDANHALTVSGTSGQVQFNSAGDLAGDAGLTFDATAKALTIASGTQTASNPALNISQTWNNSGVTFTGATINVTDTASASGSLLFDARVGAGSVFKFSKGGAFEFRNPTAQSPSLTLAGTDRSVTLGCNGSATGLAVGGSITINRNTNAALAVLNSNNTVNYFTLTSDNGASNVMAQRDGIAAQTKRLYGTYTDASNYERGYFTTDTNGLTLGTEAAGTGVKRPVRVVGPSLASAEAVSALELSQTWNTTGTPTALKVDVTDTASNASSLLMDLRVGGGSKFRIDKNGSITTDGAVYSLGDLSVYKDGAAAFQFGGLYNFSALYLGFNSGGLVNPDVFIGRRTNANLRFGAPDVASPIAQTLSVQSVVAGTTNTAGANLTITGSQGTGTGAGGSIVFQVAPAGSSGSAQNALETVWSINSSRQLITPSQGSAALPAVSIGQNNTGLYTTFGGTLFAISTQGATRIAFSGGGFAFKSDMPIGWSSGDPAVNAIDVFLNRDAANTLAQRNGVNAQTFRLYNTYTDGSNYERAVFDWTTTANTLTIGTQAGGTGSARSLAFVTGGTTRLAITGAGVSTFTNTLIHQAVSSAYRIEFDTNVSSPRIGFVAGGAYAGGFELKNDIELRFLTYTTNGTIQFITGGSGAERLRITASGLVSFGGATSSFPALKPSSTKLQARLADDSAFTAIQGMITTETNATAGTVLPDSYLVLYDAVGTAYKVPCVAV